MIRIGSFISRRWTTRNALLVTVRNGESTAAFESVSSSLNSTFEDQLQAAGGLPKTGQVRNFFNASDAYPIVTVVGHCDKNDSSSEGRDEDRENIRKAIATGIKSLNDYNIDNVAIATDGCATAAAEAAQMTIWNYKQEKIDKMPKSFSLYDSSDDCSSCSKPKNESFSRGLLLGDAQNLARHLMELPSNLLTPTIFAEKAKKELEPLGVAVNIYDSDWIKSQNMNAFWSVAKGSSEEPKMVEMIYEGPESDIENTFCLIGKGVTFDSGGISIKPSAPLSKWLDETKFSEDINETILALNLRAKNAKKSFFIERIKVKENNDARKLAMEGQNENGRYYSIGYDVEMFTDVLNTT